MKNIKGLTLIETMISIILLGAIILSTLFFFSQRQENMRAKQLGNDMSMVLNAIDKKIQMDAFSTNSWSAEKWSNKKEFIDKLIGQELRTANSTCGKTGGWTTDYSSEPLALIPCDRMTGNILPFSLDARAALTKEDNPDGSGSIISLFNIDYFFNSKQNFKEYSNILVKAQKSLDKFEGIKSLTVHNYNWINIDSGAYINLETCLSIEEKCGLRTQIEVFSGLSSDRLRIDGRNSLMGEIDFDNSAGKCTQWTNTNGNWAPKEVKCTVKGGFDSDLKNVEAFVNTSTVNERIALKDTCEVLSKSGKIEQNGKQENWVSDTATDKIPCGMTTKGTLVTAGFDKINTSVAVSSDAVLNQATINNAAVKEDALFYKNINAKSIVSNKSATAEKTSSTESVNTNILDIAESTDKSSTIGDINGYILKSKNVSADNAYFQLAIHKDDIVKFNNNPKSKPTLNMTTANSTNFNNANFGNKLIVDTRDPKWISQSNDDHKRTIGKINGNIASSVDFFSGYTPNGTEGISDQAWNTLKIKNLTTTTNSIIPSITGSTKNRSLFRTEMNNPAATDLETDIYKDNHTFYSDPSSKLVANSLRSDGVLFTKDTKATTGSNTSGSALQSTAAFSDEVTTVKGNIVVRNNGANRVVVTKDGLMTITGEAVGSGHSSSDFIMGWPNPLEGTWQENGFRDKTFRNSIVMIVNGTANFYGNIKQWKPFHVKAVYTGSDVCDRPNGVVTDCMITGWRKLNEIQNYLKKTQIEYNKLNAKLPPVKGAKGDDGEQGFKGIKGLDGYPGTTGERGPQGPMAYLK